MPESAIHDVSDTAFMIARYRAIESSRPDALFRDPFAERLAGDRGKMIVESLPRRYFGGWSVALRTVIIDDYIQAALSKGDDTVVNIGKGLDTRHYRMDLSESLRWIEIDFPSIITHKESLLTEEKRLFKSARRSERFVGYFVLEPKKDAMTIKDLS
jgi:methyltransferase (TIGR00027 family)